MRWLYSSCHRKLTSVAVRVRDRMTTVTQKWRVVLVFGFALLLVGCSFSGDLSPDAERADSTTGVIPKAEPKSRYGNPKSYVVFGQRYYVLDSAVGFVERGVASWYGKKFHGRRTSSGETYGRSPGMIAFRCGGLSAATYH